MVVISCQNMVVTIMNKRIFLFNFFLQKMLEIKKLFMGFFYFIVFMGFFILSRMGSNILAFHPVWQRRPVGSRAPTVVVWVRPGFHPLHVMAVEFRYYEIIFIHFSQLTL